MSIIFANACTSCVAALSSPFVVPDEDDLGGTVIPSKLVICLLKNMSYT